MSVYYLQLATFRSLKSQELLNLKSRQA